MMPINRIIKINILKQIHKSKFRKRSKKHMPSKINEKNIVKCNCRLQLN